MFEFLGAAGAGVAAALPLIGSALDYRSQSNTNAMSAHESALNRDFEAQMSNTAYQRATQDMKNAGLNPMLAYSQGGASTPGGSTASFTAPRMGQGFQSAAQAYADYKATSAGIVKTNSETDLNLGLKAKALAEARASNASASIDEQTLLPQDTDEGKLDDVAGGARKTQSLFKSRALEANMRALLTGDEQAWGSKYFKNRAELEEYRALSEKYGPQRALAMLRQERAGATVEELKAKMASQAGDLFSSAQGTARSFGEWAGSHLWDIVHPKK